MRHLRRPHRCQPAARTRPSCARPALWKTMPCPMSPASSPAKRTHDRQRNRCPQYQTWSLCRRIPRLRRGRRGWSDCSASHSRRRAPAPRCVAVLPPPARWALMAISVAHRSGSRTTIPSPTCLPQARASPCSARRTHRETEGQHQGGRAQPERLLSPAGKMSAPNFRATSASPTHHHRCGPRGPSPLKKNCPVRRHRRKL
mmetsp:Transcript_61739/g.201483  ORF Transcript_61739/g.201483 Transcript_61739/m.201483 type:complete len:201 (-) Transcript_61739:772-1374(-)